MGKLLKIFSLALFLSIVTSAEGYAVTMRDFWKNMPDSVIPYLDGSRRMELIDYVEMKVRAEVKNSFDSKSVMDTVTTDFLQVTLSRHSSLQVKRLPSLTGDSLFCVVRTYGSEAQESVTALYQSDWSLVSIIDFKPKDIITRPADMDVQRFQTIVEKMGMPLVSSCLSPDHDTLSLMVSVPFVFREDKKEIGSLCLQKTVKWNGTTFK